MSGYQLADDVSLAGRNTFRVPARAAMMADVSRADVERTTFYDLLPIRGVELEAVHQTITAEVADSPRCTAVEQVRAGVSVRMAVLYLLLGGAAPAETATRPEESA